MMTTIKALRPNGDIEEVASYTLEPKESLIAFYMQHEKGNYNTWEYPQDITKIRQVPKSSGTWYYDAEDGTVYSAEEE